MTYKLNPIIERIQSPVRLLLPDGERRDYGSGTATCKDTFTRNYQIKTITADKGTVVIELVEADNPATTWIGEAQSLFDG